MEGQTQRIALDHVPDGFRHLAIGPVVPCDPQALLTQEGDCFVGRVEPFPVEDPSHLDHLHVGQRKVHVRPGQLIPLILCYRRSIMELASRQEPYRLRAGDRAYLLGGDGYAGSFQCGLASYGKVVSVEIVGGIRGAGDRGILNAADGGLADPPEDSGHHPFVVAVLGVRMDSGKSTTIRRLVQGLSSSGLSVATGKVSGFGCLYETAGLHSGPSADFTDFGLPSTCGFDLARMLDTADRVLAHLSSQGTAVVILEFGGGLIDPYHVHQIYGHLRDRIHYTAFVAFDLCGVRAGKEILAALGSRIDLVSGPLANTSLGIELIDAWTQLPAESNQGEMGRTCAAIAAGAARLSQPAAVPLR